MRRRTLQEALDAAIAAQAARPVETLYVFQVDKWPETRATLQQQHTTIAVQHAEIAQLRMLLRSARNQLELTRNAGADYQRLTKRIDAALAQPNEETDE